MRETLGEAGLQFDQPDLVGFAEAAALLARPGAAREAVLRGQDRRVRDFSPEVTLHRLRDLMGQI